MHGTLHIVATPIGNLDDLSPRARRVLESVRCIACEDTRRTARLLERFGIRVPTVSCHRFNERAQLEPILGRLRRGHDVALVSDGGTPGVSDPGSRLVAAALDAGVRVSPIPGPCAVTSLLSVSGLPADRFVFEGFLPARPGERRRRLRELRPEARVVVAFEAPHRIRGTLADVAEIMGDRTVVLGRELSKLHETVVRARASQVLEALDEDGARGEITLALAGADPSQQDEDTDRRARHLRHRWRRALDASHGDRREALRRAARELGMKRAELYRRLAELGET